MFDQPDEDYVREESKKITPTDIEKVVNRSEELDKQFGAHGPLRRFISDSKMLMSLIKDYRSGAYRNVLYGTVAAAAFSLIYVFNPFDIVPDVLPVIGVVDDASVIAACLLLIEQDLFKYRDWKMNRPSTEIIDADPDAS